MSHESLKYWRIPSLVNVLKWYGDGAGNTVEVWRLLSNPNASVAVSKALRAIKLCFE